MSARKCTEEQLRYDRHIIKYLRFKSSDLSRINMFFKKMDNGSLPQKVDYNLDAHLITGKQTKKKKIIEWAVTILGWVIILGFLGYIAYGNIALHNGWEVRSFLFLNEDTIHQVNKYYYILFIILLISIVVFIVWKNYNKKKYGSYHRREFRPAVGTDEIAEKFGLTNEQVVEMQTQRVTILEKNIIPKDMGIGNK